MDTDREEEPATYVQSPYSSVGRSWAMLCAPPGTEDSADEADVVFAALALLCGNTLAHLAENVPSSHWYRLMRIAGPPSHTSANATVARFVWWVCVTGGGGEGMADTFEQVANPVERRRLLESGEQWLDIDPAEQAKGAMGLERALLSIVAEPFQVEQLVDGDEVRKEWANALMNLHTIADVIITSDVRRGHLKRLWQAPAGVLA